MKTDILILLFAYNGRDTEAMIPLGWYLEHLYHYKIHYGQLFDSRYLIDKCQPKMILLNNIAGSTYNVVAADYAFKKGIKVVTLTSEGLFISDVLDQYIWGNNPKRQRNWDLLLVWTDKYLKLIKNHYPQLKTTFDVSGSTGIDRFRIYQFASRQQLLNKYQKDQFDQVIVYAGWAFNQILHSDYLEKYGFFQNTKIARQEMVLVRNILHKLILNNPKILFILKRHPDELGQKGDIDYSWKQLPNVLILEDQETIGDLINICDLYMVYESSSTFEAYALGKTVINIFPSGKMLARHEAYKGNALIKNSTAGQRLIEEFFQTGQIQDFQEKSQIRQHLIKDNIGAVDGLNSWRTAGKIDRFLRQQGRFSIDNHQSLTALGMHLVYKYNFLLKILPHFRGSLILNYYNNFKKFDQLKANYYPQIRRFAISRHLKSK